MELDKLVNIYSYGHRSLIVLVYAGRMIGGELCTDEECLEARLFKPDDLPWDAMAFDSTTRGLRDYCSGTTGHTL